MLKRVADRTYNCLSIDAEGSTSDTVVLLANGAAGGAALRGDDAARFEAALLAVCEDLVRQLAKDGEGRPSSCSSRSRGFERGGGETRRAADRELDAREDGGLRRRPELGSDHAGARARPDRVAPGEDAREGRRRHRLREGAVRGAGRAKRAEAAHEGDELTIAVDLGLGKHASRLFTCDLTYDYVKINAEYTT